MTRRRLRIPYPILVEGKYDRFKLDLVVDGTVLTTDGFGIFNRTEKRALVRELAQKTPIIVLTDSDAGGRMIRSALCDLIPEPRRIPVYIPRVPGKEKRKSKPGAEGVLGVEGMEEELLYRLLEPFENEEYTGVSEPIAKLDFYRCGLTGGTGAQLRRDNLCVRLSLPGGMRADPLLEACRYLMSREEFYAWAGEQGYRAPEKEKTPESNQGFHSS